MMRKTLLSLLAIMLTVGVTYGQSKKHGYKLKVKFDDMTDSVVYLVHYFGKPLPTIYKTDSVKLDSKGVGVMESDEELLGGIYMLLLSDRKSYFEFLLKDGDQFTINATASQSPDGLSFKNSPENERFIEYVKFLKAYGKKHQKLMDEFGNAKTADDTAKMRDKFATLSKELTGYRTDYLKKYPNTLLANIFNALKVPQVPEGEHKLPDGTEDKEFAYRYYKSHYWDDFNFSDDRLINTPIFDGRLDEYFSKLVLQNPDSIEKEGDILLAKAEGSPELFKYTLWWLTRYTEQSKVMGMDAAFVYFVENYHMKGKATWLSPDDLAKYIDRVQKIAPNVIGNVAPELKMPDVNGVERSLHAVDAKYTLLIFWSPECGHCLTEMPIVDSLYEAKLKKMGVKIYGVRTDGTEENWKKVIKEKGLDDWIQVHDPERKTRFRSDYDIYSTPVIYLLDDKKIIRGKRMDHTNIIDVIEMVEKQKNKQAKAN